MFRCFRIESTHSIAGNLLKAPATIATLSPSQDRPRLRGTRCGRAIDRGDGALARLSRSLAGLPPHVNENGSSCE